MASLQRLRPPLAAVHGQTLSSIFQRDQEKSLARSIAKLINGHSSFPSDLLLSTLSLHPPSLSLHSLLRSLDLLRLPSSALHLFHFANLHLPPHPRLPSKTLSVLCRSRDLSAARSFLLSLPSVEDRLFNTLIRAYARNGDIRAAVSLFHDMPSPSVFSFNSLLSALLQRGRTNAATKLFAEMPRNNVGPDLCTFNTLIRGFCLNAMVDEAFRFFQEMTRRGCQPDVVTYNTLLDGLCRAGKVEVARNLFEGMRKRKSCDFSPNVVSYTTLIRGFCAKLRVEEALGLFEEMFGVGLKPNKITYNTLIQGLCESRKMEMVKSILERGRSGGSDGGFKPDVCTFNTIIAAHCNMGHVEDALKVYDGMLQLKVKPDSASYTTLMRSLCQIGEFSRAEELFDEIMDKEVLLKKGTCVPLMAAYNPIFEYLCKNGKAEKAGIVFRQLLERRATVDITAFKTLILGHCKEDEFRKGYELVIVMVRRDLVPDVEVYEVLIEGFLDKEKVAYACKALQRMMGSGHRPGTMIFHSVLAGLLKKQVFVKEAADLVLEMFERKVRQNIDLSTDVIVALFGSGLVDRAFEVLGLIYSKEYYVRMEKIVAFLCESKRELQQDFGEEHHYGL
ncbi:TPR-like protein [Dioscorea alata]|uniref:TPR-like protein n=5 Tax=Dioscorea alata TaxID=55571 RepID=A0ACB7WV57_DIOAL|nr:TPR-like protein [Dioscorea alata]KAH7692652.1 TPR-like protein [Dioscorea alata]KAH7692653.1 TPR-like protein [Dioscorea alata]KAH7692654.1 TPR-like protein [Dioscorea alata]KAH7692655.1 TPR-like protein [Dioscorea alata]